MGSCSHNIPFCMHVTALETLPGYRLLLTFEDGKRGIYDMTHLLDKGVFARLQNPGFFSCAYLDHGVPTWPGDIDIAPERLWTDCTPLEKGDACEQVRSYDLDASSASRFDCN